MLGGNAAAGIGGKRTGAHPAATPDALRAAGRGSRLDAVREREAQVGGTALTEEVRAWGAGLLHQQCWQWGCDIRRPEGNLLIEYGFERDRPDGAAATRYLLKKGTGCVVVLWGFGLFAGRSLDSGVYVNRYEFAPRAVSGVRSVYGPEDFGAAGALAVDAAGLKELAGVLRWAARYEEWVAGRAGWGYRWRVLASWGRPFLAPEAMPEQWRALARAVLGSRDARWRTFTPRSQAIAARVR